MKTNIKKIFCKALICFIGATLMGCNKENQNTISLQEESSVQVIEGTPDYSSLSSTNVIRLAAWVSPPPANWNGKGNPSYIEDEYYKDLKDSDLNAIYALYENNNYSAIEKACQLAEKYGVKYYVRDTGHTYVDPVKMELEPGDWSNNQQVKQYSQYDSFAGHLITDEPNASEFEKLRNIKRFYETEFPGKDFYVNLFPTYASLSQLGTTTYQEYIHQYIETVNPDYISYDHYALMVDGYGKYKLTDDNLFNLEVVASECKQASIPMMTFVQIMSYSESSRCPNEQELRYQIMTQLAYGSKGIQYFCYWTPIEWGEDTCTPAMITMDGQKTERYYYAKTVNEELLKMDEAYLNFDWDGTMVLEGSEGNSTNKGYKLLSNALTSHEMIKEVKATQDALVGTFTGKDGRKAFMITNFDDPAYKHDNNIEITFNGAKKVLIYHYGNKEIKDLVNGKLEYKLDPGDGIFVIPFK